jgi:predicted Zn-dependent protease
MEQLVVVAPTPEHWKLVVDSALATPGLSRRQYLHLYRLRLRVSVMEGTDYAVLFDLARRQGLPYEARSVVQKGIDTGALSAAELVAAIAELDEAVAADREMLAAFEAEAVASTTGEADVRLGETLWTHGRAAEAEIAIRRGLEKGGVQDVADGQLVLGMVLLELGKKDEAIQMFHEAEESPSNKEVAHVWSVYASI